MTSMLSRRVDPSTALATTTTTKTTTQPHPTSATAVAAQQQQKSKLVPPMSKKQNQQRQNQHQLPPLRMRVEKDIVDELLLVCGVIGTTTTTEEDDDDTNTTHSMRQQPQPELVPVTDCLNWLQDLQRCLRRDDENYRPISLLLGDWRIVSQKLLPLVQSSVGRLQTPLVLTVCKILVLLTKPLSTNAIHAAVRTIDTKSKKTSERVIREQILMRDNALKQASLLMEYKRLFCHHPSHRRQANANKNKNASQQEQQQQQGGIFSVFVSILAEPLSRTGNGRTDADHLTIELVLHLFRNLLAAEPLLNDSATNSEAAETLHHELVSLLDRELVLEILLVLSADIELRENAPYNLLLMELLRLLLRHQDPVRMARSGLAPPRRTPATATARQHHGNTIDGTSSTSSNRTNNSGSLLDSLRREKNNLLASATSRHSNFGGTWVLESGRHRSLVSASLLGQSSRSTTSNTGPNRVDGTGLQRRKSKQTEPFVGAKTKTSMNSENSDGLSPAARRAATTLHSFCKRFVATCYGPVMKSLKNEFRRDSVRLEEGDRVVWFQIVAFFSQWWRTSKELGTLSEEDLEASTECGIGQLIFTMDVFTFNLVLNSADAYLEQKKFGPLAHSVALLGEMLHLLFIMYSSESSSTEHIMAMGLMDRLYYGSDPLDRLPKLISRWTVSTTTRQYLCNLLTEVCHVTLMLLDASAAACSENESSSSQPDATVANMKAMVKEFDVASYFTRKIVSNHFVSMITYLLSQYNINGATVNQRLVDLLERIAQHTLSLGDETSTEDSALTPLAANKVTMEPMLFNVQMLLVLNTILNDSTIRHDSASASLVLFAATTVANFAQMAQENPILYVEALFKYPFPHRYCELVTNNYVTDDLRMLAERDWLLQKQQLQTDQQLIRDSASGSLGEHQAEQETLRNNSSGNNNNNGDEDDESEDEELEFTDIPSPEPLAPQVSKDGDLVDSDDDDSDENDNGESNSNTGQTNMTNVGENDDLDELTTKRDVSTCDWRTSDGSPPPSKVSKQSQELDDKSDEDDDSDL